MPAQPCQPRKGEISAGWAVMGRDPMFCQHGEWGVCSVKQCGLRLT